MRTKTKLTVTAMTVGHVFGLLACLSIALPAAQQKQPVGKPTAPVAAATPEMITMGKTSYDKQGCGGCHAIAGKGGTSGPDLTAAGAAAGHNEAWFEVQVTNPKAHNPGTTMPAFPTLKGKELTAVALYLVSLKGTSATTGTTIPMPHRKPAAKPDPLAVAKVQKAGGLIGPVAENDDHLDINFRMAGATITDKDLTAMSGLKSVVTLNLAQTGITDAGLAHLQGLKELEELHLEGTHITDAGLVNLRGLTSLTYLNLYGDNVTDAGLDNLVHLTKLKHLFIWQTKVTPAGADKLKKQLPQLDIIGGWDDTPKK